MRQDTKAKIFDGSKSLKNLVNTNPISLNMSKTDFQEEKLDNEEALSNFDIHAEEVNYSPENLNFDKELKKLDDQNSNWKQGPSGNHLLSPPKKETNKTSSFSSEDAITPFDQEQI